MIEQNIFKPKSLRKHGPLTKTHPKIAKMWDYKKNKNKKPSDFGFTSVEKIHWICSEGHRSFTKIYAKAKSVYGCSICYHNKQPSILLEKSLKKYGSLKKHPYLIREYDKSNTLKIQEVPCTYRKRVKWICHKCNNKWQASPKTRLSPIDKSQKYSNCPVCKYKVSGEKIKKTLIKKRGSLEKISPDIMSEWDYKKNKILPSDISPYSSFKVWWQCKNNKKHKWLATPANRIIGETGCPKCIISGTSRAEIRLYTELLECFKEVKWKNKIEGKEIDIFLENYKIGFEIDGHYHATKKSKILDKKKNIFFKKKGIKIVRLRHKNMLTKLSEDDIFINTGQLQIKDVKKVFILIKKNSPLNSFHKHFIEQYKKRKNFINEKKYKRICSFLPSPPPEKSFLGIHPEISKEWDYKKNAELLPSMFSPGSSIKVWWKCKFNHSFKQSFYHRSIGQGCRRCSYKAGGLLARKASIRKYGSLKEKFPTLTKEFSNKLNSVTPSELSVNSHYNAWWYCKKHNHKWQCSVWQRTKRKTGCVMCRNEYLSSKEVRLKKLKKTISLEDKFPNISSHWHSKNGKLKPNEVSYGSKLFAWFKCKKNHVFNSKINNQTSNNLDDKLRCSKCYKLYRSEMILEARKKNKKYSFQKG